MLASGDPDARLANPRSTAMPSSPAPKTRIFEVSGMPSNHSSTERLLNANAAPLPHHGIGQPLYMPE